MGLALSGGGSRAIAFHLGCLRAIRDAGLLPRIQVLSGVSGGAVLAAMYAYSADSLEEFEGRVVVLLRRGLVGAIFRNTFFTWRSLRSSPQVICSGLLASAASVGRFVVARMTRFLPKSDRLGPPAGSGLVVRRRVSRTEAFEWALAQAAFGKSVLTDPRRDGIDVVLNATELATGTAFRFGSRESGCWRLGRLADNRVPVAHAVAASAAYPALLPAFDEDVSVVGRDGKVATARVLLSDGGVYDNSGLTCMEPGRSAEFSFNAFHPEYVIGCDAGQGQFEREEAVYWWPSRMKRAMEAVFRKASDATRAKFLLHAERGGLKGLVLPYLGQQDESLPVVPPDLVRREEVMRYPTDFSPMTEEMIRRLALRGEQLTRLLLRRYCPDL